VQVVLSVLAILTIVVYLRAALNIRKGRRQIARLEDLAPIAAAGTPEVSVVIPARNEEKRLEQALQTVLAQAYPRLEIIVVNDRSTDRTGAILDRLSQANPILRPLHISGLPEGWLGKNYALNAGANEAKGEWILFADADVMMERTAVARALRYAIEHELDQLAVAPRAQVGGFLSNVFLGGFALMLSMYSRPWRVQSGSRQRLSQRWWSLQDRAPP
jgi:glycosyltransferase involved in cell wall biosynthesis